MTGIASPTVEELIEKLHHKFEKPDVEFIGLLKQLYSGERESDGAFHILMTRADEFFDELIVIFQPIREEMTLRDTDTWNWHYLALLDCIASASSPGVLTVLHQELSHPHPEARQAAINNLASIGKANKEARKVLWNARKIKLSNHEETYQFRAAIEKALHSDSK